MTTVRGLGLAPSHPLFCEADLLIDGFADTVRHRGGLQHTALLSGIGQTVFVNDITAQDITAATGVMRTLLGRSASFAGSPGRTLVA